MAASSRRKSKGRSAPGGGGGGGGGSSPLAAPLRGPAEGGLLALGVAEAVEAGTGVRAAGPGSRLSRLGGLRAAPFKYELL